MEIAEGYVITSKKELNDILGSYKVYQELKNRTGEIKITNFEDVIDSLTYKPIGHNDFQIHDPHLDPKR